MKGISRATALAIGCSAIASGAHAQATPSATQQASASSSDVGDIIVTARRTEERLQDVPISITVFNQAQLAQRNIVTPADLATYTPSLSVSSQFGPEKSAFIIRGFTQELGTSPSVATYFADVVSPRAQSGTVSGNAAGNLFDLQSAQVLKGPQGTLFGRNTTGGAVLLVPQKPTDKLEGYIEGSAGDYGMLRGQAVLNLPVSDAIRFRFGVDRNKRDGYIHNLGTGPDLNDLNYLALRGSVVVDIAPNLENYTVASYSRSSTNGYGTRIVGCDTAPTAFLAQLIAPLACAQLARSNARGDPLTTVESYSPGAFLNIHTWQAINTTTFRVADNLTVKNIASYSQYREKSFYSLFGDNFLTPLSSTLGPIPFIDLGPAPGENMADQSTFTEELQLSGRAFDSRLTWQAGAYLEVSHPLGFSSSLVTTMLRCSNPQAFQCSPIAEFGFLGPILGSQSYASQKTWFNNKGFYAQGTYKLTEKLAITGGIRYTIDKTRGLSEDTIINYPAANTPVRTCRNTLLFPGLVTNDRTRCRNEIGVKSEAPTWLVDLEYKPVEDLLLFAKYTRGYRQGGVNMSNIGLETWKPEKVDDYELGIKKSFRGTLNGYLNVVGFYNDFRDQQIQGNLVNRPGTPQTGGTAIVNAGKSRIWGTEVDSALNLFTGFQLQAGYSYLNTKLLKLTKPVLPATSPFSDIALTADVGKPLAYAPKNRVTLTGTYTLPLDASIGRVSIGATYIYTASQNSISPSSSPFFYKLPSTSLVNLNLDWKDVAGLPVDASLFVTNVTNRIYPVASGGAWTFAGFTNYNIAPPRMFGARVRYRFGR